MSDLEPPTHAHAQSRDRDESITAHPNSHVSAPRIVFTDRGVSIVALCVSLAALVIALVALDRSSSSRDLAEARYADLVARNEATSEKAKLAERNSTVAVERSHDLMARTGRLESKAGLYSTDH